jgi:hypothetical protein
VLGLDLEAVEERHGSLTQSGNVAIGESGNLTKISRFPNFQNSRSQTSALL